MAKSAGISAAGVHKLWAPNDLKPHPPRTFKFSIGPNLEEKFWDVIGLCLGPPMHFTPSSSSSMNMLERFFRDITA